MAKYRKKPVVIEAVKWDGTTESANEIIKFAKPNAMWHYNHNHMTIHTLEGDMSAQVGDFIIKGVQGEFYPCKPGIFEATYEVVE
jgi:hypothetical protein